jgi:hypothetical protein
MADETDGITFGDKLGMLLRAALNRTFPIGQLSA